MAGFTLQTLGSSKPGCRHFLVYKYFLQAERRKLNQNAVIKCVCAYCSPSDKASYNEPSTAEQIDTI